LPSLNDLSLSVGFLGLLDALVKLTATSWTGDSVTDAIDVPVALEVTPLVSVQLGCVAFRTLKNLGVFNGLEGVALLAGVGRGCSGLTKLKLPLSLHATELDVLLIPTLFTLWFHEVDGGFKVLLPREEEILLRADEVR
jgi:hypothetical protein